MSEINLKLKTYDELTFEISRLNTDKYLLEQKLQQKENIIKEVREYNERIIKDTKDFYRPTEDIIYSGDSLIDIATQNLEILEKGE